MKELPILFRDEMVRAILDGRKTQTRRPIPNIPADIQNVLECEATVWTPLLPVGQHDELQGVRIRPRYPLGARLWVREAWSAVPVSVVEHEQPITAAGICRLFGVPPGLVGNAEYMRIVYRADGEVCARSWRPSIFMPRLVSRIDLEVTQVRVQRVRDISEEDAWDEGVSDWMGPLDIDGRVLFASLWDSIHARSRYAWERNPWVFAYTFRVLSVRTSAASFPGGAPSDT